MKTTSTPKEYTGEYVKYESPVIPVTPDNYQDEFLYGKSIEKIKAKQVSGFGSNVYMGNVSYNSTGVKTVTVGFRPKMVKIWANNTQSFSF